MNKARLLTLLAVILLGLGTIGCESIGKSLRNLVSGKDSSDSSKNKPGGPTRYSDDENVRISSDRQYKRMNRQKFEEESDLKEDAGSLWVMEGQGAYLFSQNQIRMVGDLLNVKIEGGPKSQLQTKVRVIARLLERLENPPGRGLASQQSASGAPGGTQATGNGQGNTPAQNGQPAAAAGAVGQPAAGAAATAAPGANAEGGAVGDQTQNKPEPPFAVQAVPTRIVEQLKDGSYRVRGMQPFMIGKREYKVIVTGVVRPEDFDDAGIDASKLLDPQFDIVSSRKGASL